MRISLRELMIVVAVAAVALAGLKYASGGMRTVVQVMTGVLLLGFVVKAAVDRGREQAFAIGFALCALLYLAVYYVERGTNHFRTGVLGTAPALRQLYDGVFVTHTWVNKRTAEIAENFQPIPGDMGIEVSRIEQVPTASNETKEEEAEGSDAAAGSIASDEGEAAQGPTIVRELNDGGFLVEDRSGPPRGRRGRSGFGSRNVIIPPDGLNNDQAREYALAGPFRRSEIDDIVREPSGRAAIAKGAPLSSLRRVNYRRVDSPFIGAFYDVGYCVFALLIGYLGGSFARYVYRAREKERAI